MTFSTCRANLLPLILIVILLCSATGCGGGGDSAAEGQTADHGAALSMEFVFLTDSDDTDRNYDRVAAFDPDACQDLRIDTIQIDIRGNSDDAPITSMSFNCSEHQGTISGLPEQTELSVQVAGLVVDRPDWFCQIDGIVLGQGENRALVIELSYVGNDDSPPALAQVQPSDEAQDVPTSSIICAVFSEPLAPSSIPEQFITAAAGALLSGSLSYDDTRNAICFTPENIFDPDVIYTAFVYGEVRDTAGNLLALDLSWQFTTEAGDQPDYTINASAGPGGTISPSGMVTVSQGADQSFSMTANEGYYLSSLVVDDTPVSPQPSYTFNNVTSEHTIAADFALLSQYALSITKTGSGSGTVTSAPAGIDCGSTCSSSFVQASQVTLTAEADANSTFTGWSGGGCSGTGNCTTTIDSAVSVSADFAIRTYTIDASASAGGSISPQGSVSVNHGANQTFTAAADTGYYLSSLEVDGTPVYVQPTFTFIDVTSAHTIAADFSALPSSGIVIQKIGTGSGVVTSYPRGILCGQQCTAEFLQDYPVALTAFPAPGSTFKGFTWSSTYGTCESPCWVPINGLVTVYAEFSAVTSNTASFLSRSALSQSNVSTDPGSSRTSTITATASAGGSISPQKAVSVYPGSSQAFTISPATGFCLSELYIDGTPVDVPHDTSDLTYSFNDVTSDHTIEASFAVSATLLHRWQFNGDWSDIGASQAQVIDPDNFSATGDWALGTEEVTLHGGAHNQAAYISLGDNLLPDTSFTIEIWGSHLSVGYWDPIWFIGKDDTTYLTMYWNTENDIQTDLIRFRDLSLADPYYVYDSYSPLTLDAEYHIVLVAETGATGEMQLRWYAASSSGPTLGAAKGNIAIPITPDLFDDASAWLGRSPYSSENVANARYNEVRIWNGALTQAQLEFLHKLGPNNLEE